jgi:hypothetical protein
MPRNAKALRRFHMKHTEHSIEGVARRRPVGGFYVVERAKLIEATADGGSRTVTLDSAWTEIPVSEVLFVQVIAE